MKRIFENVLLCEVFDETRDGFRNVEIRVLELNRRNPQVVGIRIKPEDIGSYRQILLATIPEIIAFENIREGVGKSGKPYRFTSYGLDRIKLPADMKKAA